MFSEYQINAGESLDEAQQGFNAKNVIIDNPTGQWYFIPSANRWVPPYQIGVIIPLLSGTQKATVLARTPIGLNSNPLQGQQVNIIFTDTELVNAAGAIIASPQLQAQELPSYSASNDETTGFILDTLDEGALTLWNPEDSNTIIKLRSVISSLFWDANAGEAIEEGVLLLYRTTTEPSGGASIQEVKHDTTDPNPVGTVREGATITTDGDPFGGFGFTLLVDDRTTPDGYVSYALGGVYELFKHQPGQYSKPLTLRPGEGIVARVANAASLARCVITYQWTEEPLYLVA